jgi:hypothetical protein
MEHSTAHGVLSHSTSYYIAATLAWSAGLAIGGYAAALRAFRRL